MVLDFSPLLYEIRGKNTGKKLWKLEEGKREKRKGKKGGEATVVQQPRDG